MDARGVPPDPPTLFIGAAPHVRDAGDLPATSRIGRALRPDPRASFTVEGESGLAHGEKIAVLREHGVNA